MIQNTCNTNCNSLPCVFVSAGKEYCTYEKSVAAPLFKKEFEVTYIPELCEITIGCTGFFEIFLNGCNITDGLLVPFQVNCNNTIFYRKYDVTDMLRSGKNTVFILLGNGFANPFSGEIWNHHKLPSRSSPAFAFEMNLGDMTIQSKDFVWTRSPLLYDDYRTGTYFDARQISEIENDTCIWLAPYETQTPTGKKRLCDFEPVRIIRKLKPKILPESSLRDYRIRDAFDGKLHKVCDLMTPAPKSGGIIYDFGENTAGIPLVKFKNTVAGQTIHMQFTELLFEGFPDYINVDIYPDGCCQQDIYVCRGADEEIYSPPFTYHGARYCYLHGASSDNVDIEFAVIRNDVAHRSHFECSEDISNEIYRACIRSDESNLHNILTDCPAREKNGWTGDASVSADHFLLGFAAEKIFSAWMSAIGDMQNPSGSIPYIIPSEGGISDSVIWDSVLFSLPYYCYKYSGNKKIILDNSDAMKKNLLYHLSFRDERGIVDRGMGDWLPVDSSASSYASPLGFCCSAMMAEMCRMGEIMMNATGNIADAEFYRNTRKELIVALRKEYIKNGTVGKGNTEKYVKPLYRECQTSQAIGLFFDIFEDAEKKSAVEKLVSLIHENGDSFDCGFLGLRAIFHVLSEYGYGNLAHKMITKPTHPSYANMIYRGETTVWERFVYPGGRTGSHNHHFMGEPSMWFISDVLGIKVNPYMDNPNKIVISPDFIEGLSFAKGHYENTCGKVEVSWRIHNGKIELDINVTGKLSVEVKTDKKATVTGNWNF